jgi:hypothetical protein
MPANEAAQRTCILSPGPVAKRSASHRKQGSCLGHPGRCRASAGVAGPARRLVILVRERPDLDFGIWSEALFAACARIHDGLEREWW